MKIASQSLVKQTEKEGIRIRCDILVRENDELLRASKMKLNIQTREEHGIQDCRNVASLLTSRDYKFNVRRRMSWHK